MVDPEVSLWILKLLKELVAVLDEVTDSFSVLADVLQYTFPA
jgi:hypothetical protein